MSSISGAASVAKTTPTGSSSGGHDLDAKLVARAATRSRASSVWRATHGNSAMPNAHEMNIVASTSLNAAP